MLENEADHVHFDTIHGTASMVPLFLRNIIEFGFKLNYWKVCDPPNTHCSKAEAVSYLKFCGLTLLRVLQFNETVGPGLLAINITVLVLCINLNFKILFNIITLGDSKQLIVSKWYSEPSILGFIFAKIMILSTGCVVSIE